MTTINSRSCMLAPAAAATSAAAWVQVTTEGDFRGYPGGPFRFDRQTFETIVANFRAHPSYSGGNTDVVPWDFHHASEFAPGDGSIPVTGAPAQGWVQDLAIRRGPDGRAQLWAKTRWLEPARSYIKDGRYKWASVVVDFGAKHPETGAKLGPTLVSVAITNNPFVEGMAPLVAASRDGGRVAASRPSLRNVGTLRVTAAAPTVREGDFQLPDYGKIAKSIKDGLHIERMPDGSGEPLLFAQLGPDGARVELPARGEPATAWVAEHFPELGPLEVAELASALVPIFAELRELAKRPESLSRLGGDPILLSAFPGANRTQKAVNLLRQRPGFSRLPWDEQVHAANEFVRRNVARIF